MMSKPAPVFVYSDKLVNKLSRYVLENFLEYDDEKLFNSTDRALHTLLLVHPQPVKFAEQLTKRIRLTKPDTPAFRNLIQDIQETALTLPTSNWEFDAPHAKEFYDFIQRRNFIWLLLRYAPRLPLETVASQLARIIHEAGKEAGVRAIEVMNHVQRKLPPMQQFPAHYVVLPCYNLNNDLRCVPADNIEQAFTQGLMNHVSSHLQMMVEDVQN
ncbi:TPA: hypothetical protein ACWCJD_004755 [Escherichia coli]|uniref:hypothetical protein n=2 Tax=Escherichia coli TaxID=562 RepID=UPI0022F40484|nr:hypothetical protein [Escherichia coli]MDA5369404.1 hypothetical protein [Escherichia coli]MDA5378880.1 hypothetical protein [Escherichia coli]